MTRSTAHAKKKKKKKTSSANFSVNQSKVNARVYVQRRTCISRALRLDFIIRYDYSDWFSRLCVCCDDWSKAGNPLVLVVLRLNCKLS